MSAEENETDEKGYERGEKRTRPQWARQIQSPQSSSSIWRSLCRGRHDVRPSKNARRQAYAKPHKPDPAVNPAKHGRFRGKPTIRASFSFSLLSTLVSLHLPFTLALCSMFFFSPSFIFFYARQVILFARCPAIETTGLVNCRVRIAARLINVTSFHRKDKLSRFDFFEQVSGHL